MQVLWASSWKKQSLFYVLCYYNGNMSENAVQVFNAQQCARIAYYEQGQHKTHFVAFQRTHTILQYTAQVYSFLY